MLQEHPINRCGADYPGLSLGHEARVLENYLNVLEQQIQNAQAYYVEQADLSRAIAEDEEEDKLWAEIDIEANELAAQLLPQLFRQGALVAIWGHFESFVSDFAAFIAKRRLPRFAFRDVRAANFRVQTEKFFEGVVEFKLPWTEEQRGRLAVIQELRNFCAHRNGRVGELGQDRLKDLQALCSHAPGVVVVDGSIYLSAQYIEDSASLVSELLDRLNLMIANAFASPLDGQ